MNRWRWWTGGIYCSRCGGRYSLKMNLRITCRETNPQKQCHMIQYYAEKEFAPRKWWIFLKSSCWFICQTDGACQRQSQLLMELYRAFCVGTRWYGVPALFLSDKFV